MVEVKERPKERSRSERTEAMAIRKIGIVGAGGIGATLDTAFSRYEFPSAAAILLVIIGIVMALEYSSGYIRRWVQ